MTGNNYRNANAFVDIVEQYQKIQNKQFDSRSTMSPFDQLSSTENSKTSVLISDLNPLYFCISFL